MYYEDILKNISKKFDKYLEEISVEVNFDFGEEFEVALCKVLRGTLPSKYGVCRGFVTDRHGNSAGDDIIIYDRIRFPTLRLLEDDTFAQKQKIPVEAVYSYIEAKHTLNIGGNDGQSFQHAVNQVSKVKELCSKRPRVEPTQISPYVNLKKGLSDFGLFFPQPDSLPSYLNPLQSIIFARNVREKKGGKLLTDKSKIEGLLSSRQIVSNEAPDMFVLGKNHLIIPFVDDKTIPGGKVVTPFYLPGKSYYEIKIVDGIAYSVALTIMMAVIDWIQLGSIPWSEIIAQLLNERKF